MQRALVFGLIMTLGVALSACGEKGSGGGAKTPEELLDKFEAMAEAGKFVPADMLAFIHPDEQPAFAFMMSVLPMIMAPMMAAFAQGEEKAEKEAIVKQMEGVLEKYGLADAAKMEGMKDEEGEMTPEKKLAKLNALMKGVDHVGLVRDAWALLDKMGDGKQEAKFSAEEFAKARASLVVDGDHATMSDPDGSDSPLKLVKASDGYWYVSAMGSGWLEQ